MHLNAYRSDPAVRDAAIERLRRNAADGRLVPGSFRWDGAKGSVVGCILASADVAQWTHGLGLPQWLATAADGVGANLAPADALAFGVDLLGAIRPGADVSPAGSAVILDVLADAGAFVGALGAVPAELCAASDRVRELHRRVCAGERPAPTEWRAARRAATALTDALTPGLLHSLATCAETAAWDPVTSPSVVFDTLRVYGQAVIHKADAESGYTQELDTKIRAHLKLMWDTHLAHRPELQEQGITVFSLLEEHHPDVAERIRWKTRLDREAYAYANRRVAEVLVERLKRA